MRSTYNTYTFQHHGKFKVELLTVVYFFVDLIPYLVYKGISALVTSSIISVLYAKV